MLTVTLSSAMIDSVILIPCLVPCVVVVYDAVVPEDGHVNIPTFVELQIRSFAKVQNRKNYAIFS